MATLEENIARRALERLRATLPDLEGRAGDLRAEVLMYESPLWAPFAEGLERELVNTLWLLVDCEDYAETRALQRIAQRLRERLARPDRARDELAEVQRDIDAERDSLRTAAGVTGDAAAGRNGR